MVLNPVTQKFDQIIGTADTTNSALFLLNLPAANYIGSSYLIIVLLVYLPSGSFHIDILRSDLSMHLTQTK